MSTRDFENVKRIFALAERKVKNDAHLGQWLIKRGSALMLLGAEELKNPMSVK